MQITRQNVRPWARSQGWTPHNPGLLAAIVHDEACWVCDDCEGRFTDQSDMACDDDGIPFGDVCEACDCGSVDNSEHSTWFAVACHVVG